MLNNLIIINEKYKKYLEVEAYSHVYYIKPEEMFNYTSWINMNNCINNEFCILNPLIHKYSGSNIIYINEQQKCI